MAKDLETSKKDNFRQKMQKVCKLCSAATIDVYVRNTLRLVKLLDPQAKIIPPKGGFLENPKIFTEFDKLNLNQRRLLSTAAVKSLDAFGKQRVEKWATRLANAAEEYDRLREKRQRSEKEKSKWPTKGFDSLRKAARIQKQHIVHIIRKDNKTLRDLWEIQKWLVLVLYSSHALRLDFADVYMQRPNDENKNFLFKYKRKGWILTMRDYKTSKTRGQIDIKMSRPASLALTKVTPWINTLTKHGKLLTNAQGSALSRNGLSKLLTRLTEKILGKKGFSASLIRVLKSTKHRSMLEQSKALADEMMHSQKQNLAYSRK